MFADEILAPEASCKTFDASTDGYARAEGITAVYIKPLADALRHGNSVRAVIRATSITCDGKGVSLVTPNGDVHEALMRATYSIVGLDPKDTAFIECHATGTLTGDPIETTAVEKVFGEKGIFMTSVKANLGNCEGSAELIETEVPNPGSHAQSTKIDTFSTVFATKISPKSA
ncbi:Highly reducing polyketide synthase gloL [Fusarium oxysporum f. sp. rapae]|uniref:Highly reducing polyketide synthase gloL n=1 Tax=Fusarium oxysporum f. sp. rapae TaxID=485398 RepID=A0A8J5TZE4_FUSOX|nr:Highly reducing polyketide synthase gloL [Fusarium oxysporum f. sp. rapae]